MFLCCYHLHRIRFFFFSLSLDFTNVTRWPRGGGGVTPFSLMWPVRGYAAGQGMVFTLSVLHRIYNFE